jgi:hypothetical protein
LQISLSWNQNFAEFQLLSWSRGVAIKNL